MKCREYDNVLITQIESSDVPTFILGKDDKISYKNEAAKRCRIPIRVGAHIKNYMSASDMKRLLSAEPHELIPISLNSGDTYNCIIQRHGLEFAIKLLNLSALSLYRISQFSEYTEGKIKSYSLLISSLMKSKEKADITTEIAKKLSCMVKFQSKMNDYIKLCEKASRGDTSLIPAYVTAKQAVETINAFLPSHSVTFKADGETFDTDKQYININKADFYSLITYLVSFAVRYLREKDINIRIYKYGENVIFSAEGETLLSEKEAKAICEFDLDKACSPEYPDLIFSAIVCKMLAAHYGCRFDVVTQGIGFSRLKAVFSAPIIDDTPPLELHKRQDMTLLMSIIENEFADLDF